MAGVSHAPGMHGGSFFPSSSYKCSPHGAVDKVNDLGFISMSSHCWFPCYPGLLLTVNFHCIDLASFQVSGSHGETIEKVLKETIKGSVKNMLLSRSSQLSDYCIFFLLHC